MNSRIFRKTALTRLSSPEGLDEVVRVTTSKNWAALAGILLVIATALIWSFAGHIPTTVHGKGMIVRKGGVLNVVTPSGGTITSLSVAVGDHVEGGQIIARVAQPSMADRLQAMRDELAQLQSKQQREDTLRAQDIAYHVQAIQKQRDSTQREITELQEQTVFAKQQVAVAEELMADKIYTKLQVITAREKLTQINDEIQTRQSMLKQFDAQIADTRWQGEHDKAESLFEIESKQRDIESYERQISLVNSVVSPYAGSVLELKVYSGSPVSAGAPIISIQPDTDALEAVVYVDALHSKDVRPGMQARLSPAAIRPEEFGYIRGRTAFVAEYPATRAGMMREFQNETIVADLAKAGPATEIAVTLDKDSTTVSGLLWSSRKGPPLKISSGTLCEADIVTKRQAPITLVFPFLKRTLGG
jgi:HlyD family secretion protein